MTACCKNCGRMVCDILCQTDRARQAAERHVAQLSEKLVEVESENSRLREIEINRNYWEKQARTARTKLAKLRALLDET